MNNSIDHSILSYDEKLEILKTIGVPTDPMLWRGNDGIIAHQAFEVARLVKQLKAQDQLKEAA